MPRSLKERSMAFRGIRAGPVDRGAFERFRASIEPGWIEQALVATGTATLRKRRLPAEQVVWLVLGMALFRDLSIEEVVRQLEIALPSQKGGEVVPSAIAQARSRLGAEPMEWLFGRTGSRWGHESAARRRWCGLALYGVDGTTARVPDSDANRLHYGPTEAGHRGMSGYPLVRLVTLMALRSHLLVGARFGPYTTGEMTYAADLWSEVPNDSLTIVDRYFFSAPVLVPLARDGQNRHWLIRARKDLRWKVMDKLGPGDERVEMTIRQGASEADETLTRGAPWPMRAIRYRRRGFRPQTLLTSLLDADRYPAEEIVALYHERWELELGFDEVKTEMLEREEAIRSRTPEGVRQELWGLLLAYNLVRREMEKVADEADIPPTRISFVAALRMIRLTLLTLVFASPGVIPKRLQALREDLGHFILPERRSARSYPRAVKIKMSNYPRMRPKSALSRLRKQAK
jgi:hypothetical protein